LHSFQKLFALGLVIFLFAGAPAISSQGTTMSQASSTEEKIWRLEHAYWQYVQDNNLVAYRALWHQDFVGWPSVSAAPVTKDHITDWITSQTSKGMSFKAGDLKPAAIHVTGNITVAYYWISHKFVDKDGNGDAHAYRISHTWVKVGNDWQIIGGMSMLETAAP
jgi:ketosteroid isomerase-like protein